MKIYENTYAEMLANYTALKRCKRIYNIIGIFYAAFSIIYAYDSLEAMLSIDIQLFPVLLDGIVFKAATLIFGYGSCYSHKNVFSLCTIIISLCSIIMAANGIGVVSISTFKRPYTPLLFLCIFAALVVFFTNIKYKYLEEQPGFPYFSERFEEQKFDSIQTNIKSEFQQSYEKRLKTATDKMEELDIAPPVNDRSDINKQ